MEERDDRGVFAEEQLKSITPDTGWRRREEEMKMLWQLVQGASKDSCVRFEQRP